MNMERLNFLVGFLTGVGMTCYALAVANNSAAFAYTGLVITAIVGVIVFTWLFRSIR